MAEPDRNLIDRIYGNLAIDNPEVTREFVADVLKNRPVPPAWHPRPTEPGLWLCVSYKDPGCMGQFIPHAAFLDLSRLDLARGAPFAVDECFGPIPKSEGFSSAENAFKAAKSDKLPT